MPLQDITFSFVPNIQYAAPTVGQTVEIAASTDVLIIEPAGTLATLTINLPAGVPPSKRITVASTQIVTALTFGGNGNTILNGITAMAVGGASEYIFRAANNSWYRVQ